ncbi:carbohydrate ABC transporter permease [Glycomyces harbinensis]|uniref:Multiple sugar transport system permease protein n=1 Tax=Glycomyces harbinensis TaxID=58114 RepID=A0A1G6X0K8_9ACTN|nr:sugar ABC transporter permease [Glycomyces harbinensis]SDD70816.1 multiple sugar transport system permease protein [Glycomyces harbinensis]
MTALASAAEGGRAAPRRRPRPDRDRWLGAAFVAPQALGVIVLGVVPFFFVIWYSFNEWRPLTGQMEFIGLENYSRLIADPTFSASVLASLLFSAGVLVLNLVIAIGLAVLLNRRMKGTTAFRTIFFSPVVVSVVAWSVTWGFLLAPNGGINGALDLLGVTGPNWLADPSTALISLVVVQVFKGVGMNMVLFLAALQSVPEEIREAAQLDGASPSKSFWSITVPMIAPTILLTGILTTIGSLEVFAPVQLLTGGGPGDSTNVLPFFLYRTAFISQQFGYASAIGVVLFAIILALTMLQWTTRRKWVHDEV